MARPGLVTLARSLVLVLTPHYLSHYALLPTAPHCYLLRYAALPLTALLCPSLVPHTLKRYPLRFRDLLLDLGTHWTVAVLQLAWLLALVAVFVVFVCCLLYWFGWGEVTDEEWGCTANSTCCTCHPPALTYKREDYWQEKMTQGLSALFTYSVLLATPWRLSILVQCFDRRCKDSRGGGVGFYGKPNAMPFFYLLAH